MSDIQESPFFKSPSCNQFSSVFVANPEQLCNSIHRSTAPRRRNIRFSRSTSANLALMFAQSDSGQTLNPQISVSTSNLLKI